MVRMRKPQSYSLNDPKRGSASRKTLTNKHNTIMTNFDLIAEAIERMNAGDNETAIARLKQFTALNTPKVKSGGKVKICDWAGKDEYHPSMKGVFHDAENKVAVATDTHVMIVSKADYIEDYAGRIIDKKGDDCKGRFPDYKRVIPKSEGKEIAVNREHIASMLSEMRAERKIDKSIEYLAFNVGDKDTPCYIKPANCKLLLTLPEGKFFYPGDPSRPLLYKSDDGNYTALMMPVFVNKEFIGQDKITPEQRGWN